MNETRVKAAVRKYGSAVVHRAMSDGWVSLDGVEGEAAFDPANATAGCRLRANATTVA